MSLSSPLLENLRADANIIAGKSAESFGPAAKDATVILHWSGSLALLKAVFGMCPNVRWVHSRSAGLDKTLFPELIERPVPLTNGSGVFSPALAEFVLGAILYFAKDFRRMIRNQMAGVWEAFDVMPITGQTVGIVGYGDIGRAVAAIVRPLGMPVLAVKRHVGPSHGADPLVEQMYSSRSPHRDDPALRLRSRSRTPDSRDAWNDR